MQKVSSLLIESQGKDMYLVLENDTLSLVDPMDRSVLHAQPIVSIRVWGVGRDSGRWEQGRGSGVGAQPAVRARPSSLTLLFASLVLPDPERGTMPNLP